MDEFVSPCQYRAEVQQQQQLEKEESRSHCEAAQSLTPQRSWNWDKAGTARVAAEAAVGSRQSDGIRASEVEKSVNTDRQTCREEQRHGETERSGLLGSRSNISTLLSS